MTARPYWGVVLLVGTLLVPVHSSSSPQLESGTPAVPRPFLAAVDAQIRAGQAQAAIASAFGIRIPEAVDPQRTMVPAVASSSAASPARQDQAASGPRSAPVVALTSSPARSVPSTITVVVREGQTIWQIATSHRVPVDAIVRANQLRNVHLIRPGQQLTIPGTGAAGPQPSASAATTPKQAKSAPTSPTVVVRKGQALWNIAEAYGVSIEAIVEANNLESAEVIQPGQTLTIPGAASTRVGKRAQPERTISVVVEEGQTLWDIAQAYGISVEAIVEANTLRNPELIQPGQRLAISTAVPLPRRSIGRVESPSVARIARGLLWPARGMLTSRFGWRWRRHHDGIDIAAPRGSPIQAAKAGRVVFSGWYYGYGRTVIMDHGGGLTTLYGHASTLLVRIGQFVEAGQIIARVGCTGHCSGSHLHFEIRLYDRAVNPLRYL